MVSMMPSSITTLDKPSDLPTSFIGASRSTYHQDIREFLEKPINLGTYTWTAGGTPGTVLNQFDFPANLLASDLIKSKTRGYLGLRAKVQIRVQLNANKFAQGRMIICWLPMGSETRMYPGMRTRNLKSLTQLPHVGLDANTGTEAVLHMPYVSNQLKYNVLETSGVIGRVFIAEYLALANPSGDAIEYTVWANFTDIDLDIPTYNSQSGSIRNLPPSEAESQPFARSLKALKSVVTGIAGIPNLAPAIGMPRWLSNITDGLAMALGYSKPVSAVESTRVVAMQYPYQPSQDGADISMKLGSVDNKVMGMDGFSGTSVDEMALNYLASIPSWHYTLNWKETDPGGLLFNIYANPSLWVDTYVDGNGVTSYDCTPASYLCQFFQYWRGGIRVTLKCAKTSFHTGRLVIAYLPGVATNTALSLTDYAFRDIIDLREGNEWTFDFPYMATQSWKSTTRARDVAGAPSYDSLGLISIYVLNKLNAPTSVSNNIDFAVEVSMLEDAEFAGPLGVDLEPYDRGFSAQSGAIPEAIEGIVTKTIGGSQDVTPSHLPAGYCIGEKIASLRSLLKKPCVSRFNGFVGNVLVNWDPTQVSLTHFDALLPARLAGTPNADWYNLFGACFLLARGGVKVFFPDYNHAADADRRCIVYRDPVRRVTPTSNDVVPPYSSSSFGELTGSNLQFFGQDDPKAFVIPQFLPGQARVNKFANVYTNNYTNGQAGNGYFTMRNKVAPTSGYYARSLDDDGEFGFFIGVPPLVAANFD